MRIGRLAATWLALMLLLAVTVGVTFLPIGDWRQLANLTIAGTKAALVLVFFMKLPSEQPLVRLAAGLAAALLFAFTAMLTADYQLRPAADAQLVAPLNR